MLECSQASKTQRVATRIVAFVLIAATSAVFLMKGQGSHLLFTGMKFHVKLSPVQACAEGFRDTAYADHVGETLEQARTVVAGLLWQGYKAVGIKRVQGM